MVTCGIVGELAVGRGWDGEGEVVDERARTLWVVVQERMSAWGSNGWAESMLSEQNLIGSCYLA